MAPPPDGSCSRLRSSPMALAAAVVLYLLLAIGIARTKAPWCDEGWFANPAYNLAFHGRMGTNVLSPSGHFLNAYLSGIQERTYIVTPNHLVGLAAWFRVFGFSLFAMRLYSILWGVCILLVIFCILRRLLPDKRIAQFAILLTATDFVFLWTTADGRMEAPACALALCSLAAYLHFREQSFSAAVLISQLFAAAAVFTHPNALIVTLTVFVLAWRQDRGRLRPWQLALAAAPYALFALPWLVYIHQAPSDFTAQFFANAAGSRSARWKNIVQPWLAMYYEALRHLSTYLLSNLWSAVMNPAMVLIPFLYLATLTGFFRRGRLCDPAPRTFTACLVTILAGMTFLNGFKAPCYILYALPFYNAVLSWWLLAAWERGRAFRFTAVWVGTVFIALQLASSIQHICADEYARDYLPAVHAVKALRGEGKSIVGSAVLGFGAGFTGFTDDWRLGLYSGLKPDAIVLDRSYREFAVRFEKDEPAVFSHIIALLPARYHRTHQYGSFWIFERVAEPVSTVPPIDIGTLDLQGKPHTADYIFEMLAGNSGTEPPGETRAHNATNF